MPMDLTYFHVFILQSGFVGMFCMMFLPHVVCTTLAALKTTREMHS